MPYRRVCAFVLLSLSLVAPAAFAGKVKAQVYELDLEQSFEAAVASRLTVENLLGTIRIKPQPKGRRVRLVAKVLSEATEPGEARRLAQEVRLVRKDAGGEVRWTVVFPDARLFRTPKSGVASMYSKWLAPLVKRKTVSTRYNGRAMEIGNARGATAVSVTLEVEVPMDLHLTVLQHVGTIECNNVRGNIVLELKQGELEAGRVYGALRVTTEGASARIWGFDGERLNVETGSGKIELNDIRSTNVRIDSARGAIYGNKIESKYVDASTGSGKVLLEGLEPVSMKITSDTGSVELATELKRTKKAVIRSSSGDVIVRLGTFASFRLEATSATGEVKGSGVNVTVDQFEKNTARLARGKGGAQLNVESQSGKIVIRPL